MSEPIHYNEKDPNFDEMTLRGQPVEKAAASCSSRIKTTWAKAVLAIGTGLLLCSQLSSMVPSTVPSVTEEPALGDVEAVSFAFQKVLQTSNHIGDWLYNYTQIPHLAGSPGSLQLAEWTAEKFTEYGFDSSIEAHNTYINYPGTGNTIKVLKPGKHDFKVIYEASLVEDVLKEDPTTSGDDLIPAFHGYSAAGNVTGPLVFANYGTKEDFDLLEAKGVNVKGSVVIVRYGKIFRGLKVMFAEQAGAVGCLIYSDPADDYVPEGVAPYPDGPGRNPSSIQRGSVQFLSMLPGDPARFTDGSPEAVANLTTIPHIPSLPISYKEAEPILKQLNGFGLDLGFEGGLASFEYTTGPSISQVNVFNNVTYNFTDIYNTYGLIEGEDKDRVLVIGNHRDAWIKGGAGDPNSGSALMLEIARAFSELFKLGWKPKYSILLASWDGEEYGLLGSTAYAEKYAADLGKKAVAYLNCDVAAVGSHLNLQASPMMNDTLRYVASQVAYPGKANYTLLDHLDNDTHGIGILGSGSDYTVFYEHLGIPSADMGFTVGKGDAVYHYHSNYDSYHWMATYGDPGFKYHNALSQFLGLLAIQFTEPKTLQAYNAGKFASMLKLYFEEKVESIPKEWLHLPVTLDEDDYSFCEMRGGLHLQGKKKKGNFTLEQLIKTTNHKLNGLDRVAHRHDKYLDELQKKWEDDVSKSKNPFKKWIFNRRVNDANEKIKDLEKAFIYEPGLNGRSWFKNTVFASGRYTGYAGQTLPGLQEAIEDKDFDQVARWIGILRTESKDALISLVK